MSKADAVAAVLVDYRVGDWVYYFSHEFQRWMPAWVSTVDNDGVFVRYHRLRPTAFLHKKIAHNRLRPRYERASIDDLES